MIDREINHLEENFAGLASLGKLPAVLLVIDTRHDAIAVSEARVLGIPVIGIMNSFLGLANQAQATLQVVAPGIAEALIATAMGLFAAIPAVVAYNKYSANVDHITGSYITFSDEFSSILHRQIHSD